MRILHVEKFLPPTGGVGSHLRALAALQERRGHRVLHFGTAGRGGPAGLPPFEDFTAARSPGALARMVHNERAAEALRAFLRDKPVDVAHLHNIYHHLTPSILPVLARHGAGVVMTVHDYRLACPTKYFLRPDGPCTRCLPNRYFHAASPRCAGLQGAALAVESYLQRLARRYFRHVSFFLCPSEYLRRVLVRTGVPAGKAVVLRNVIEPLPPVAKRRRTAGRQVLWAGRLSPEKAPELALELAKRLPDATVVLAGEGPLEGELRRRAARENLRNVRLPGAVPHEQMGELLAESAALVLTSRWFENSPQVMLEAMSAGCCVVAPDHPPLREWIADGRTGRLFPSGDAEALARAVADVLGDPAARTRMEGAAQKLVLERHEPDALMDRLEAYYRKAIARCGLR